MMGGGTSQAQGRKSRSVSCGGRRRPSEIDELCFSSGTAGSLKRGRERMRIEAGGHMAARKHPVLARLSGARADAAWLFRCCRLNQLLGGTGGLIGFEIGRWVRACGGKDCKSIFAFEPKLPGGLLGGRIQRDREFLSYSLRGPCCYAATLRPCHRGVRVRRRRHY